MKLHTLCNKKGAAIEAAILFMAVIFLFCTMITTVALAAYQRNDTAAQISNDSFYLDQLGEYFIAALQGKNSIQFIDDKTETRGGWFKFVAEDEENPENKVDFALNINAAQGQLSTMRIAYWDDSIPADGNLDASKVLLYVTAKVDASGNTKIYNWSSQPLQYTTDTQSGTAVHDAAPTKNTSSWWDWFRNWIKKFIKPSFRVIHPFGRGHHWHH